METQEIPDSARQLIEALVNSALASCSKEGIDLRDFHRAMRVEQELNPKVSVMRLLELTFERIHANLN
jgi:hypothetical protein